MEPRSQMTDTYEARMSQADRAPWRAEAEKTKAKMRAAIAAAHLSLEEAIGWATTAGAKEVSARLRQARLDVEQAYHMADPDGLHRL